MTGIPHSAPAPSAPAFSKGLAGVIADETSVSQVQGEIGRLIYRGIPVEQLAFGSSFEEQVHFLLRGHLPNMDALAQLTRELQHSRTLPPYVQNLIAAGPRTVPSTSVLQAAVAALAFELPPIPISRWEENYGQALALISKLAVCVAHISRTRRGLPPMAPRSDLTHVENFLYMMHGRLPDAGDVRVFETACVLHMDHDFNASTFTGRTIASTEAGLVSSIAGAVGALSGPLHGGANEKVMRIVDSLDGPEAAKAWVTGTLAAKGKVPGFGHRIYRTTDPRAVVLRDALERIVGKTGRRREYDILVTIHDVMIETLGAQQKDYIRENVDFWSGALYRCLDIESDDFTPIFALARVVGWCAHILELWKDNRIYRPSARYVGPRDVTYVPIRKRNAQVG